MNDVQIVIKPQEPQPKPCDKDAGCVQATGMDLDVIRDALIKDFERKNDHIVSNCRKHFEEQMKIPNSPTRLDWELNIERLRHLALGEF